MLPQFTLLLFLFFCSLRASCQVAEIKNLRDSLALVKDDHLRINLLIELAKKTAIYSPDSAMQLAMSASVIAQNSENEGDIAKVYKLVGRIYYDQGKYPQAIENYKIAYSHLEKLNDTMSMASVLNNIGRGYRRIGEREEALGYFYKSLDFAGDDKEMIGVVSNNLAMVLNDFGEDSLALHYYRQSLAIAEETKDTSSIILSLNNLGSQYERMQEFKKTEECYLKALELAEKTKDVESLGLTYDNIGTMWEDRGDYQKAIVYYFKELEYERKTGVQVYVAEAMGSISRAYLKMNKYHSALDYAMQGYRMSELIHSAELKVVAAENLSSAFEKLKQFEAALYYRKIAQTIGDSLNSIEKARTVSNLSSHYELTKKEAEIKTLNLEKQQESQVRNGLIAFLVVVTTLLLITIYLYRERKRTNQLLVAWGQTVDKKNEELDNLNKVKDKIFSSIAHDVRSPLASIQSLLSLIEFNSVTPAELQRMAVELSARVNTTSALLENLLNWSKNQIANAKINPVKTNVHSLTNECFDLYRNNAVAKNIQLINKISDPSFVYADEEMIKIILRNLISNAIKFTRKDGEVRTAACVKDGKLRISVSDSGVGISLEDISRIFSLEAHTTPGTAKEKGTGLGLILCKDFIEKNKGEIWVESQQGEGSTFYFTVPLG